MSDLFESAANFLDAEIEIEYLIEDIIEKNTFGALYGEAGAGKSFIAVDLGLSVAVGIEIFNNNLAKMGLVLYLAGEGHGGLKRRIKAWQLNKELNKGDMKHFFLSKKTIGLGGEGINSVIEDGIKLQNAAGMPLVLIIVDTLARHMEGDENDTKDMNGFVREMGRLKDSFPGSVVLIVHHTGHIKSGNKIRMRGAYTLKAAIDFEILVHKGNISFTKMKDSEPPVDIGFRLNSINVGVEKNGNQIRSCTVEYVIPQKTNSPIKLKGLEVTGLEALINVCILEPQKLDGKYFATFERWKFEFKRLRLLLEPNTADKTINMSFQRSGGNGTAKKLESKGVVLITEVGAFPIRAIDQAKIADAINKGNENGT
jgi:hypothetical protein